MYTLGCDFTKRGLLNSDVIESLPPKYTCFALWLCLPANPVALAELVRAYNLSPPTAHLSYLPSLLHRNAYVVLLSFL